LFRDKLSDALLIFSKGELSHPFRKDPFIHNPTLGKLGVRKEKDALPPESDLLSGIEKRRESK